MNRRPRHPLAAGTNELVPDLILQNERVATLDPRTPEAEAVAVLGDRIVAVGQDADIRRLAGARTRVVDLRGNRVIPGLMDNHTHYLPGGP